MKCENECDDCKFCYMTDIIQRDIRYQTKYGYIPGSNLRQKWKCITCKCRGQLSKYTSEKGIQYDKKFIITYRGFCLDCMEKQKLNRTLIKQIIEFDHYYLRPPCRRKQYYLPDRQPSFFNQSEQFRSFSRSNSSLPQR